jgi:SAM-dependent methyltransferase
VKQERRLVFGHVAELYERVRPSYPDELVQDVVALAGVDGSGRALEIGAGTGKATRLFAARGVSVLALEPSASMAALARETCAGYDRVTVLESEFEQFAPRGERFQLLFSAQAWHWISREVRFIRAREALAGGGLLAVFWSWPRWQDSPVRSELLAAYRRAAPDFVPGGPDPMHPATDTAQALEGNWQREIAGAEGFERPEVRAYDWSLAYSADEYLDLLQTHSGHIVRPEAERRAILDEVGAVIGRHGGSFELPLTTVLCLAAAA